MREKGGGRIEGAEMKARWWETVESVGRKLEAAGGYDEEVRKEVEDKVKEWHWRGGLRKKRWGN